ncbi:MAG TPA: hypothetical protein VME47_20250 [Acetobacteraceae bacterium]|nr:hypothetical protein [Acetobacteraceae bacterium]
MQEGSASGQDGWVGAELIAVIVAVSSAEPRVLTIDGGTGLPSGPFATAHRSLQAALRSWVEQQTHHPLGYVEQLYTFADRDRTVPGRRVVSISYLGLTREMPLDHRGAGSSSGVGWQDWYRYFPWEDRRDPDAVPIAVITNALQEWADGAPDAMLRWQRRSRVAINFALDGHAWNEDLVLQRYETLWEAGLVPEAGGTIAPGQPMAHDHRRILATGIARLRGKIKYRPLVFELMPPEFTLGQLQRSVEALAGRRLHKQNFRRLVEQQELVEETGRSTAETGGRPAKLFRFRKTLLAERAVAGTKLPLAR